MKHWKQNLDFQQRWVGEIIHNVLKQLTYENKNIVLFYACFND